MFYVSVCACCGASDGADRCAPQIPFLALTLFYVLVLVPQRYSAQQGYSILNNLSSIFALVQMVSGMAIAARAWYYNCRRESNAAILEASLIESATSSAQNVSIVVPTQTEHKAPLLQQEI